MTLKYLNLGGLEQYDGKIKTYIGNEIADAGTTILTDAKSYADQVAKYTGESGITVADKVIKHTNTVGAGALGDTETKTLTYEGTFDVPYANYDANGHITSKGVKTLTLPAAPTTITGNAGTASKLETARTITLEGNVTGSVSFDGSENISITTTVADDSHNHIIDNIDGLQAALDAKAALVNPEFTGTPVAPTAPVNTNTTQIATTAFVVSQINSVLAANNSVEFKGVVDGDTPLPSEGAEVGDLYVVAAAGTYGTHQCEVGDMLICTSASDGTVNWHAIQTNLTGAVTGPASSVTDNIAIFDGSTGKIIKDGGLTIASLQALATTSSNGMMSATDKAKLDNIAERAEVNQNAFSTIMAGETSVAADAKTDTLTIQGAGGLTVSASGKTITLTAPAAPGLADADSNGLMSSADFTKLAGIAKNANNYIHPTTSGNKHIPAGGASGNILRWSEDGTAAWGNETTYTLSSFDVTATAAELNHVKGVTSSIQTQLNGKQATITGAASSVTTSNLTASRALIAGNDGKIAVSAVTSTELGYLDGVTSSVQTQLNSKQATITGAATTITGSNLTTSRALISDGSGKVAVSAVTSTELGYLDGVTSAIQTQLNGKAASSHTHAKNLYKPTKTYQKVAFTNSTSSATINPYNANMDIEVYYNGFLLMPNEDYTQSGSTITFTAALGGTGVEQTLVIVKRDYS